MPFVVPFVVPFVWPSAGPACPSVALSFPVPASPAISHTAAAGTFSGIQLQLRIPVDRAAKSL